MAAEVSGFVVGDIFLRSEVSGCAVGDKLLRSIPAEISGCLLPRPSMNYQKWGLHYVRARRKYIVHVNHTYLLAVNEAVHSCNIGVIGYVTHAFLRYDRNNIVIVLLGRVGWTARRRLFSAAIYRQGCNQYNNQVDWSWLSLLSLQLRQCLN